MYMWTCLLVVNSLIKKNANAGTFIMIRLLPGKAMQKSPYVTSYLHCTSLDTLWTLIMIIIMNIPGIEYLRLEKLPRYHKKDKKKKKILFHALISMIQIWWSQNWSWW